MSNALAAAITFIGLPLAGWASAYVTQPLMDVAQKLGKHLASF